MQNSSEHTMRSDFIILFAINYDSLCKCVCLYTFKVNCLEAAMGSRRHISHTHIKYIYNI